MLIRPGQTIDACAGIPCEGPESNSNASSNQQDQRAAIGGSGVLASAGGQVSINISNPDGFAQLVQAGVGLFEANLDFAEQQVGRAHDAILESGRSEEQTFGLQALKAAGPLLLIVGLGFALMKGAR